MLWLETARAMAPVRELHENKRTVHKRSTVHKWLETGIILKRWESLTIHVILRAQMHARTQLIEVFNKHTKETRECLRAVIERLSKKYLRASPMCGRDVGPVRVIHS